MADQQKHKAEEAATNALGFTKEQLAMVAMIMQEARKPYIDPNVEERNERSRQRLRNERENYERNKAAIENSCSHLREDNTSRVAWITNFHAARPTNPYITEGFCQLCQKHFRPGVEGYEAMLKIPVGKAGIVQ